MIDFIGTTISIKKDLDHFEKLFDDIKKRYNYLPDNLLNYILDTNGKRVRPLLVYLSSYFFGHPTSESTHTAALIAELIHIASLLHDDVIDNAIIRRQQETVNSKWDNKTAILLGDFIFSISMKIAAEKREYELFDIFSKTVIDLSEGEILEIEYSKSFTADKEKYFKVINLKTASLISACFKAGGNLKNNNSLYAEIGLLIGILFQIKDDIIDFSTDKTGKENCKDIKEKKVTLPIICAYEKMNNIEKQEFEQLWNNSNNSIYEIETIKNKIDIRAGIAEAENYLYDFAKKASEKYNTFLENKQSWNKTEKKKHEEVFQKFILSLIKRSF